MRATSEQWSQATAVSLARALHPGTDLPAAAGVARRGQRAEGPGTPPTRPSRGGALWRLLRGFAARVAASRGRRAAIDELTRMSDGQLADIGLSRGEIHRVFDPEFARARNDPRRVAGDSDGCWRTWG